MSPDLPDQVAFYRLYQGMWKLLAAKLFPCIEQGLSGHLLGAEQQMTGDTAIHWYQPQIATIRPPAGINAFESAA